MLIGRWWIDHDEMRKGIAEWPETAGPASVIFDAP
jgi:hypothetical protein